MRISTRVGAHGCSNSGFNTPIGNSLAFNIQLQPQALLEVVYGGPSCESGRVLIRAGQVVQNGAALTATQVAQLPQIYVTPTTATAASVLAGSYTVMLADAAALGNPDAQGDYRRASVPDGRALTLADFLANGVKAASQPTGSNLTFPLSLTTGVQTQYAGPGPAAGEGPHRYAWLLFQQPSSFRAQSGVSSPGHWNVTSYVTQSGLGNLIAASFFTGACIERPALTRQFRTVRPRTRSP